MKKYFLVSGILLITATSFCQEKKERVEIPSAAEVAFKKSYPAATKTKWSKEGSDFEVNFINGKNEMAAVYSSNGELKETEIEIEPTALPAGVTTYVKEHYKTTIKEAAKITKANGEINYEAEVNKKDLLFDKNGKFIKEQKD
ncbi:MULTISPECIES: PepSY-like domain-containing protein [Niastella]|uniref:PepSY-like domain-containing protein n=1 Tax=Niastella soli TaxID=2821487 RepID=A0ABS3YY66_9BACT|nr:PepSY-like domain-containing protein [Niastella soli]MBO9202867.1 PepSY-like domain-containing protein [Niastella soli]